MVCLRNICINILHKGDNDDDDDDNNNNNNSYAGTSAVRPVTETAQQSTKRKKERNLL